MRARRIARLLTGWSLGFSVAFAAGAGVNRWTPIGPFSAQGYLEPDEDVPSTFYLAAQDGVFKSVDSGEHWRAIRKGLGNSIVFVVSRDPVDSRTLFVGTDFDGIFRSVDGGETWDKASFGLSGFAQVVSYILSDPTDPSTLYAGTLGGVYRSRDRGCTWISTSEGIPAETPSSLYIYGLVMDPDDPATLYASTYAHGLYRSVDGGDTWSASNAGLPPLVYGVVFDPHDHSVLYLPSSEIDQFNDRIVGLVYRSPDRGATWLPVSPTLPNRGYVSITVDPDDSNVLYAGPAAGGLLRSIDRGATWAEFGAGLDSALVSSLHFAPDGRVYAGTGVGVLVSEDRGAHWTPAGRGPAPSTTSLALDRPDALSFYAAGARGGGIQKTTDGGATWHSANRGLASSLWIAAVAADPKSPGTAYAGRTQDFLNDCRWVSKTTDGGATWTPTAPFPGCPPFSTPVNVLRIDPDHGSRIFAAANGGLFESDDGGSSWRLLAPPATMAIAFSPTDPQLLYTVHAGEIHRSTDGGSTSRVVPTPADRTVQSLALNPNDPRVLYAGTLRRGLFRSADGGETWSAAGLPGKWISRVVVDPSEPARLYAAVSEYGFSQSTGVWVTADEGAHWSPMNAGLDEFDGWSLGVRDLAIDATGRRLLAGTAGGVYAFTRSDVPPPSISSVTPTAGSSAGGVAMSIRGAGFAPGAAVSVGGKTSTSARRVSPTQIVAALPSGSPGLAEIVVTNPDTQFASRRFFYDFRDVPIGSAAHDAVVALALRDPAIACGDGLFCPSRPVVRATIAKWIELEIRPDAGSPPASGTPFDDVDACAPVARYLQAFRQDGLTRGCGPNSFCPEAPVRRDQLAAFVARALAGGDAAIPARGVSGNFAYNCVAGPAGVSHFADVTPTSPLCRHVNYLESRRIHVGCGTSQFCPATLVSRGETAISLSRAFPGN